MLSWDVPPQAFIQRLAERDGQAMVADRDEYPSHLAQVNRGGFMTGMAQNAIRAYDGRVIKNRRTPKRNPKTGALIQDVDRANSPYLVQLLAGAEDRLLPVATRDNVDHGLLARLHFYSGHVDPKREPLLTSAVLTARGHVIDHAAFFHTRCQQLTDIPRTDAVHDARWELEKHWRGQARATSHPSTASACLGRVGESVLKGGAPLPLPL